MNIVDYFVFDPLTFIGYRDITMLQQVIYLETGVLKLRIFIE